VTPHLDITVADPSQVGEARRAAVALAGTLGLDETRVGRVALVATELGNNLVRHAGRGRLLIGAAWSPAGPAIDLVSVDQGPGMDVARCLHDGYSTGGTPGTGFGAVRRLSDSFSAYSAPQRGAVVLSRIGSVPRPLAGALCVGGVALAAPGETVCGDAWHAGLAVGGAQALLLLADGLGHGPDAARAADGAVALVRGRACGQAGGTPSALLNAAHAELRHTRGAAAALALLDAAARTVTFAGAGNIAGRLLSGLEDRSLMSQNGTLGLQVRTLSDVVYPWPAHACLVLHSDGLGSRWQLGADAALLQCDPVVIAAWLWRDHARGRDDATVVVARTE
jgi:anti-sigma regulatory factor (Ser/Thr protein kinase)